MAGLGVALTAGLVSSPSTADAAEPTSTAKTGGAEASTPDTSVQGRGEESSEDAALAEAKRSGKSVEVTSLRGESSEVFATPEGHLQAREHLRPVRTRVSGKWHTVDTDLVTTDAGRVRPKAASVDLTFSGGGAEPLVRMVRAGRELSLSWPTKLPAPSLDGDTATYAEVLPGVDLRMGARADGFTQLLVVKSAKAAASEELAHLRLALGSKGLDVRETAEGGVEARDPAAKSPVFEAPTALMWDSSAGNETEETAGNARSHAARTPAAPTGDGESRSGEPGAGESGKLAPLDVKVPAGRDEVVLTPDADVLKGRDTVYPVFIDPQWYSPRATAWTMASKYWASSPQWKFNGDHDAGMGYCGWSYCQPSDTKRLFYRVPTSRFAGKSVLSAEFVVRNVYSASCTKRAVRLYKTKGISSKTTWNTQKAAGFWIKQLDKRSFAHGYTGCGAKDAEFDVKSAVQEAAKKKSSSLTFGLRADNESDKIAWKRFSDKGYLRVEYNRAPQQVKASQLSMEYGGTCKKPAQAARVRTLGSLYAKNITDPDGDQVAVQFRAAWDADDGKGLTHRWTPKRSGYKRSGSNFAISLPKSIPTNTRISWSVRAYDGSQYSPWSSAGAPTSCYFVYDTSVPKAPELSSGEYPESDPEDPDDPWYDGVGKYGTFSVGPSESDVTTYWLGVNGDPTAEHEVTTSKGAVRAMKVLPSEPGVNFVTAQAFDAAGNGSEIRTYQYRVKAGQPERAAWRMDEGAGAKQAEGTSGERVATLHGGAKPGAEGVNGTALALNGKDGYAVTDIPTVNTANGFSVSAWVKLSEVPDHAAIIAAQPGNHAPGFELYYSASFDRWVFNQYVADDPEATVARAMGEESGDARADRWTHLVGVYSGGDKELRLFVDGELAGSTSYTTAWDARRGLRIGAGAYGDRLTSFFPGSIDDLRVFDKPVSATEVEHLFAHEPIGHGRTARAVFPLDEDADATEVVGHADTQPMTFHGGIESGQQGVSGKSLTLDGEDDYANTEAPHTDTQRSFTVSAWARLPKDKPDHAAIIATQEGKERPGFELYYSASYDRWAFNQYSADSPDSSPIRAMQAKGNAAYPDTWTHLVGVHDTVADTLTLYVNGELAGSTKLGGAWYAGGPVQLGAGTYSGQRKSFFPGQIDDVRLYDRPVSADEARQMFQQQPVVKGRWRFESAEGEPATSPDASAEGRDMTLHGDAEIGPGWIDENALVLDGEKGYAATDDMPIDTSESFTVTAWAQAAAQPTDGPTSVISADGKHTSACNVRYVPDGEGWGHWELVVADEDSDDPHETTLDSDLSPDAMEWTHLAVVYDGFSKQLRLYVNGELQERVCTGTDDDDTADDPECTDHVSWSDDVLSFPATGALQVGRAKTAGTFGGYWPGTVDDVWTFQGTLTERQVNEISNQ